MKLVRKIKAYLKRELDWNESPRLLVYRGFGSVNEVYISGSVIENNGLSKPNEKQNIWQNSVATIKRFSSKGIAGAKVNASFLGITQSTITDKYGYFHFRIETGDLLSGQELEKWYEADISIQKKGKNNSTLIKQKAVIRMIAERDKRIIVSDIDDTVLVSHSTETFRKLRLLLFKNAFTRVPFKGIRQFYRALEKGENNASDNPFFYVSSSEWNLYDLLEDFFSHNKIPKGVFMLRKINHRRYKFWKYGGGSHEHKYQKINMLLTMYPHAKFILIGDSGQKDPVIYERLAQEFPHRIDFIYIRNIKNRYFFNLRKRVVKVDGAQNARFLEVADTYEAMDHARKEGLIAST